MVQCPTCKTTYAADEFETHKRAKDFVCECSRSEIGCVKCTKECTMCANIGCSKFFHFQVNSWDSSPDSKTMWCDTCEHQHCCSIRYFGRKVLEDGSIDHCFVRDNLVCPKETIGEDWEWPDPPEKLPTDLADSPNSPKTHRKIVKAARSRSGGATDSTNHICLSTSCDVLNRAGCRRHSVCVITEQSLGEESREVGRKCRRSSCHL